MKRLFTMIAVGMLATAPVIANAQDYPQTPSKWRFGLKGGLSYGDVSNRGVLPGNLDGRSGFAAGVSLAGPAPVGMGVELMYAQRGIGNSSNTDSRKLDYIDIPVYLRMVSRTEGVAPFAYVGPQVSFEVRCQAGSGSCPASSRPTTSYAGVIGAGFRFRGHAAPMIEGRYLYGLTDLKLSTVTTSNSYKERSFLILVGLGL